MANSGYVMASKMVVDEKKPVMFMYREKPDNAQDSGWRFFSGLETQEYIDDPNNTVICDIYSVLDVDKTVVTYLDSIAGMAFERDDAKKPFKVVSDFDFSTDDGGK